MSSTIPSIITLIGGLFGLCGLAGGLAAFFKSKLLDTNLGILERTNKAQDDRIKFLESETDRQNKDLEEKQNSIRVLTGLVTGHEQLNTILEAIRLHDDKLKDRDKRLFGDLETIIDTMTILKDKVSLRGVDRPKQ